MHMRASVLGVFLVSLLAMPSAARAADPDMGAFFRRLESIGLKTETLRKLNSMVHVRYRDPNDTKEAQYGFITRRLYIPTVMKEKGSTRIRFDLDVSQINTVIHEYTHAYDFLMAKPDAKRGSNEYLHWEARNAIKADIFLNPKEQFLGLARYPGAKAIEIAGYFMGDAVMGLFEAADLIETYNVRFAKKYVEKAGDAERLGDKLVLPPKDTPHRWFKEIVEKKLGAVTMNNNAFFEGKAINWPEERAWAKQQMFENALGLHPPKTMEELVERLNSIDNESVRDLRKRVLAARADANKLLVAEAASAREAAPDVDDVRNR